MSDDQGQNGSPSFGLRASQAQKKPTERKEEMSPQQRRRAEEHKKRLAAAEREHAKQKKTRPKRGKKILPKELTSYDLWKFLACILMAVGYTGFFLFPENQELFMTVGVLCVPIWFFFIGYAKTKAISDPILWGTVLLIAASAVAGKSILALNILFTIMVCRLMRDYIGKKLFYQSKELFILTFLALAALAFPTMLLWEYGTLAIMMTMTGYVVRRQNDLIERAVSIKVFINVTAILLALSSSITYNLDYYQSALVLVGLIFVNFKLLRFRRRKHTKLTRSLTSVVSGFIKIFGRHSLAFFISMMLGFWAYAVYSGDSRYSFMKFSWVPVDIGELQQLQTPGSEASPYIVDTEKWEW